VVVTAIVPVPARFAERREAVFASVAGLTPLVRVVLALAEAGDVVVAAAEPLADAVRETFVGKHFSAVRVVVSESPGERVQCVGAGLRALADGAHVVVHNIEWPMVGAGVLKRIVTTLDEGAVAVMPARPVTDSVKAVSPDGVVTGTLDRTRLRAVHYPRGFDAEVLALLVQRCESGSFDEFEAALSAGTPVTLIQGDDEALSVELPRDAGYLAALIEGRHDLTDR